ncbi:UDP-forming cellulose synthase catalytic subunit [Hoeflea ulvae]|uniref:Cellulose synthase catalytic subunit [UDP-forming] n=1 Tax=Hoeflea ulvae TaxID=2983764 RepID=A0ABT3YGF3_9HYPH|nr:UDP-forming cellulose synthase catalytic subunit [Hoeflea ulvae]MCY0094908.1 UDP-forming cellulose synthase catalytic subunit [Hoeflea ulvae]
MYRLVIRTLWLLFALIGVFLIVQPTGTVGQLIIALSVITMLALISVARLDGGWRHIFLAFASIIVLRYAYWRTTNTLPPFDDLYSIVPALILYAAEMYCIIMLGLSLFVFSDPINRKTAPLPAENDLPTVDVFVPSYNEDVDILALTLSAAKAMEYPEDKLQVYLLDDGGTEEKRTSSDPETAAAAIARGRKLSKLCDDLGVIYHARAANIDAKAGNLNGGLSVSSGELIVVFDADHAPEKCFLAETIGYFHEDPKLFLVQTPHFFANADPIERNLDTFSAMPSENEMFYARIQKGLDRWNASFFCGSAAVLRRNALEQVGGFAGVTITEDCETALELHGRGWNSIYVDKPMIYGLQPETLSSFIGQRSRWCQGMIQILLLKNPLTRPGLNFAQRLCYLSSNLFWMFPFIRLVFLAAPILFIIFDMKIYIASIGEFFAYTMTYLVVGEMIRTYLYGTVRWPWVSELYEYIQTIYLLRAIVSVLLAPTRPTFNVTAKGDAVNEERLSELATPYLAIFVVLILSLGIAGYRYQTEPEIAGLLLVVGAWNLLNLIIAGAALGVVVERKSEEGAQRTKTEVLCDLVVGTDRIPVVLSELSTSAAKLRLRSTDQQSLLRSGAEAFISLPRQRADAPASTLRVSFKRGDYDGLKTLKVALSPDAEDYANISALILGDLGKIRQEREERRRRRSVVFASLKLIAWALVSPPKAFWMALFKSNSNGEEAVANSSAHSVAPQLTPKAEVA